MRKKVLLRAPVLTQSGYGVHSRQVASWLLARRDVDLYVQALPWGKTPWNISESDPVTSAIMQRAIPLDGKADVSFQLQLPNEWDASLAGYNVGITASVETDICNPKWGEACNAMDHVVVPSTHAKRNLTSNGNVTTPVTVVPEAYNTACAAPDDSLPISNITDFSTPFNFLIFGQITGFDPYADRKNTFFMLRWLFDVFKNDPDVGIVLKTNAGRNSLIDRTRVVGLVSQVIREARQGDYPRVHVLHGDMNEREVAALYRHPKIHTLVAATRGEGFGLPILEAAASGLPVIATDWSGHLDFLSEGKFIKLYYQLGNVAKNRIDNEIFMKGARWAHPSESDFKEKVRKFKDKPNVPRQWAADLKVKVLEKYSLERISGLYDELFGEVL